MIGCGDRNWRDSRPIWHVFGSLLQSFGSPMTVIEGECPYGGADKLVAEWAVQHAHEGVIHVPMPAHWTTLGKSAGPERNVRMLKRLMQHPGPRLVVAFHPLLMESRGTKHMVSIAEREPSVAVWLFDGKNVERSS